MNPTTLKCATVKELRKTLFDIASGLNPECQDNCFGVAMYMTECFSQEIKNVDEARRILYNLDNQDQIVEYYFNGTILFLIQAAI